jgi:hypothetical protein
MIEITVHRIHPAAGTFLDSQAVFELTALEDRR